MSYNIGPKIGIEGEHEFRQQIKDINASYKSLNAETKALTAVFEANGDQQGKLKAQTQQMQKQIELQKQKFDLLQDAVQKSAAKYGDNAIETTRLRGAMYDAQATMVTLENQMQAANADLDAMESGLQGAAASADDAASSMDNLSDEMDGANQATFDFTDLMSASLISNIAMAGISKITDLLKNLASGSLEAAADVKASASQFEQTFGDAKIQATKALEAIQQETKISVTRIQGSFTKLYAFTKNAGADTATAMDISQRAMAAAADSAAYFDKTVEEATETLQSFLKGNYENDAALGISATETTRNTKANELYAKSFKELSESQKIDVLLAMVEAGNEASGAIGQAARESDEWTNVLGEASEAIRLVQAELGKPAIEFFIPLIKEFTAALSDMIDKHAYEVLADEIGDFNRSVESAESYFAESQKSAENSAYAAQRYVDKLEELEKAGLNTTAAQEQYAAVVENLNELLPDLSLSIDEQTGKVNKSTDAIRANIDVLKKKAIEEARQEKYQSILKSQADAVVALEDAEQSLIDTQIEQEDIQQKMTETAEQLSTVHQELAEIEQIHGSSYAAAAQGASDLTARQAELKEQAAQLGGQYMSLQKQLDANDAEQKALNATIAEGKNTVAEYETELDQATRSANQNADGQENLAAKIAETQASIDELTQGYMDAKEAAIESIESQIGYFDELEEESDWTAEKIVSNWEKQKEAFDRYAENLKAAVDMGLDEALVEQLSDGSEESMLILNELVHSTELSVDDINAAFRGTAEARANVADTMNGLKEEYESGMADIQRQAEDDGIYIVDGLAQSVNRYSYRFESSMASLAHNGITSFEKEMVIASPSRKMKQDGRYTVEGAVLGVRETIADYEKEMEDLARSGNTAFLQKKLDTAQTYAQIRNVSTATTNNHYQQTGTYNIYVTAQPGQDYDAIGRCLLEDIQSEIESKEAMRF